MPVRSRPRSSQTVQTLLQDFLQLNAELFPMRVMHAAFYV
jgi:hypothetical protein